MNHPNIFDILEGKTEITEKENKVSDHWVGMPDYDNVVKPEPFITATFKFRNQEDFDFFHTTIKEILFNGERVFDGNQKKDVKSTWYPLELRPGGYKWR